MSRPKLSELSLTEKIGQLLMVRQSVTVYKQTENGFVARTQEEIDEIMGKYQFGGIWSSGQQLMNAIDLAESGERVPTWYNRKITQKMTNAVRLPVLVGLDAEFGAGGVFSDATNVSGPLAIGAADDTELTFAINAAIAREVKAAGANWKWSPVVDIPNRYNSASLGRGFSDNIEKIVKHAVASVRGSESEKIVSTIKHFPGYDPYEIRDSHFVTTSVNLSLDEWRNSQAKTFQGVIDAGVDSIMVGHTAFPAADDTMLNGQYIPATLSEKIIKGILRSEMGFEGVILTDAVNMSGFANLIPYEEALVMAVNAGNDMLLGVNPYDFEIIHKAVLDGRISMERIEESAERVLKLKEKIGLFDGITEEIDMFEQSKNTAFIDRKIAEKSVTLVYDKNNMLPLKQEKIKKVTIVCSSHFERTEAELEIMKGEFEKRGASAEIIGDIAGPEEVKRLSEENDLIVYAAYIAAHRPMGMPSLYGDKIKTYFSAFTYGKEKSVGVSMGYPYLHIDCMTGANTFFNIYSTNPESQIAFVKVLYGELEANTVSPVDIEPKLRYVYG